MSELFLECFRESSFHWKRGAISPVWIVSWLFPTGRCGCWLLAIRIIRPVLVPCRWAINVADFDNVGCVDDGDGFNNDGGLGGRGVSAHRRTSAQGDGSGAVAYRLREGRSGTDLLLGVRVNGVDAMVEACANDEKHLVVLKHMTDIWSVEHVLAPSEGGCCE